MNYTLGAGRNSAHVIIVQDNVYFTQFARPAHWITMQKPNPAATKIYVFETYYEKAHGYPLPPKEDVFISQHFKSLYESLCGRTDARYHQRKTFLSPSILSHFLFVDKEDE